MRLFILLLLTGSAAAEGKCVNYALHFLGDASPVPTNAFLVLEGYGKALDLVREVRRHQPQLVAGEQRFDLEIVETAGGRDLAQAVVRPRGGPLSPRTKYRLELQSLSNDEKSMVESLRSSRDLIVTTANQPDEATPYWSRMPRADKPQVGESGEGLEVSVDVTVEATDDSPLVVRVESPEAKAWYAVRSGRIHLAQTGCGVYFPLSPSTTHKLKLTAYDSAGNIAMERPLLSVTIPAPPAAR